MPAAKASNKNPELLHAKRKTGTCAVFNKQLRNIVHSAIEAILLEVERIYLKMIS